MKWLGLVVGLWATGAWAVCPPAWEGSVYDATAGKIKWCIPDLNAAGKPHAPGELDNCDLTLTYATGPPVVNNTKPVEAGVVYSVTVVGSGLGNAKIQCFNVLGMGGLATTAAVAFPTGTPGQPAFAP